MKKLKYYYFLIRWFLIGKNFCDTPLWAKKGFWVCHKILWCLIFISLCYTLHKILEWILL